MKSENVKTMKQKHQEVKTIRTIQKCEKHRGKRITPCMCTNLVLIDCQVNIL